MSERKSILLRLDPAVHDALARWAADELRSTTAQIEFLLRQGLARAGRLPGEVGALPRRGRPPRRSGPERPGPERAAAEPGSAASEPPEPGSPPADGSGPDRPD